MPSPSPSSLLDFDFPSFAKTFAPSSIPSDAVDKAEFITVMKNITVTPDDTEMLQQISDITITLLKSNFEGTLINMQQSEVTVLANNRRSLIRSRAHRLLDEQEDDELPSTMFRIKLFAYAPPLMNFQDILTNSISTISTDLLATLMQEEINPYISDVVVFGNTPSTVPTVTPSEVPSQSPSHGPSEKLSGEGTTVSEDTLAAVSAAAAGGSAAAVSLCLFAKV